MIPRFDYSFSAGAVWQLLKRIQSRGRFDKPYFTTLFPQADVFEISSARVGIKYALQAFQLNDHARIGVQPFTCSSVLAAIASLGYTPVFIDIDRSLTIDCADLVRKVDSLDALLVTHMFSNPADVRQLRKLVGRLPIIEDCAHAFLTSYDSQPLGTFFDIAVFSFGHGKFPALGDGGVLVVNTTTYSPFLSRALSNLPSPNALKQTWFLAKKSVYSVLYSRFGYSLLYSLLKKKWSDKGLQVSRYPAKDRLPYAVVHHLFDAVRPALPALASQQRRNAFQLINRNRHSFDFIYPRSDDGCIFSVVLITRHRDALYDFLIERGIGAGKHFQHALSWATTFGYSHGDCPSFEYLQDKLITIPCHTGLTDQDLEKINLVLRDFALVAPPVIC
ncbi:DegT/DnrJ/EryC1/StrS family aminotransferase [Spirosoma rigui]|uniref:DegT/DnrJ/EryC1/StrS family aminotransferase n=1 Tax=Spirosoma rigui TaxID=564064 RepID=UPI0009AFC89F|nr:DegT/DnrJ/EryC1/StrS family aminotransferase [Spirosoma rigui]